ncbi:MAG: thioredoxin domain-containing protein [Deferribacterota bacterium]|nr:thioredoxin domain-containing protein [Deferribacterota bacterium]
MTKRCVYIFFIMFVFVLNVSAKDIAKEFEKNFQENLKGRNIDNVSVSLKVIKKLDFLPDYYLSKLTIYDKKRNKNITNYVITDGRRLITDIVDVKEGKSIIKEISAKFDTENLDTSKLTLYYGSEDAQNKIVEVTDFDCPFCRKAYNYIKDKVKKRDDVALYFLLFPLEMHRNAKVKAKIFEAGMVLGYDFSDELFNNSNLKNLDSEKLILYFANKVEDKDKFIKLVNSEKINKKIEGNKRYAQSLGINATPIIYINGKKVRGFDKDRVEELIENLE